MSTKRNGKCYYKIKDNNTVKPVADNKYEINNDNNLSFLLKVNKDK